MAGHDLLCLYQQSNNMQYGPSTDVDSGAVVDDMVVVFSVFYDQQMNSKQTNT